MAKFGGKAVFETDYDLIQGKPENVGANLFKIILEKFDYSDFYAEIQFVKMMNVNKSYTDTLCISGTWHNESGKYEIHIHNMEFKENNKEIVDYIYMYTKENELYVWGRYPGKYCGYSWQLLNVTSRAIQEAVKLENIHNAFITKNELKPEAEKEEK